MSKFWRLPLDMPEKKLKFTQRCVLFRGIMRDALAQRTLGRDMGVVFSRLTFFPTQSYRSRPALFPTGPSPYCPFAFPMTEHSSKWHLQEKPAAGRQGPAGWLELFRWFLSQISNLSSDMPWLRESYTFVLFLHLFDQAYVSWAQCLGLFLLLCILAPHDSNEAVYAQVCSLFC